MIRRTGGTTPVGDEYLGLLTRARAEQTRAEAAKRLAGSIGGRIRTTMIGAIAAHEEFFGFLYGVGPFPVDLTPEEVEAVDVLEGLFGDLHVRFRTQVLDRGNRELRAAQEEVMCHEVRRVPASVDSTDGSNR
jgi:hypothetical protein